MIRAMIRLLLFSIVLASAVGMAWWWHDYSQRSIRLWTVDQGELLTGVTVSGTVRNKQKTTVASEIVAAVARMCVREGQQVQKGQVLVELDDSVLAAECAKSQARIEVARQTLAELKAGTRKEELERARQAVVQAQSELDHTQKNFARLEDLRKRGAATASELSLEETKLKVAQSTLKSAQADLDLLEAGARPEQIARAEAEVRQAQAELQRCQALRAKCVLHAPHRGIVTARYVDVGEVVSPGQLLMHLNNLDDTEIRAAVQETQLTGIRLGHKARVLADAYPDKPLEAIVEKILPRVDPESGAVTVLLRLHEAPAVALMDGMAVDIALVREQRDRVIRVPAEAVRGSGESAEVWVRSGPSFEKRFVELGATDGHWVEIRKGLDVGEVVRVN